MDPKVKSILVKSFFSIDIKALWFLKKTTFPPSILTSFCKSNQYLEILNDSHEQAELEGYNEDEDNDNEDFVIYSGEPYIGDINGNKIGNDSDSDFSICF